MNDRERLFVYGTLRDPRVRRGVAAALERATWLGFGAVRGRLHDAGGYPAGVLESDGHGMIQGEVIAIPAGRGIWEALDGYEGYDASRPAADNLFERVVVEVRMETGERLRCLMYVYVGPTARLPRIAGVWRAGEPPVHGDRGCRC